MSDELIKKEEVLKIIQDIKCDESIPKNYGTLLDIMRRIRKIPAISTEDVISREDFVKLSEKFDKLYLAKCEEVNRLKAELGQSVKLPCKVGDKVYSYCSSFGILEYYVDEINVGIETTVFLCSAYSEQCGEYQSECLDEIEPGIADFGKTVFLTREEAQAKLEERDGE